MAKLVDASDLGSDAARHGGSSPSIRTNPDPTLCGVFLYHFILNLFSTLNIQFATPNAPTEGILKIAIEPTDIQPRVDKKLKEMALKVNLKGFRPGKVPQQVVKKMFGQDVLGQELNSLLNDTISKYFIDNRDFQLLGTPSPIAEEEEADFKNGGTFKFAFKCGVVPPFQIDLSQLYIKNYEVSITDESTNQEVEKLREGNSNFGEAEITTHNSFLKGALHDTLHDYSTEESREAQEGEAEVDNTCLLYTSDAADE